MTGWAWKGRSVRRHKGFYIPSMRVFSPLPALALAARRLSARKQKRRGHKKKLSCDKYPYCLLSLRVSGSLGNRAQDVVQNAAVLVIFNFIQCIDPAQNL